MAAETIIDIKAGMEYDNTPRCPLQPFLRFGVLPDCISLEFVLRVKVFFSLYGLFEVIRAAPFCYV